MQAKLPDINAALVTHRNAALHAFDINDFTKATISIDAMNSLLPEDYKVEVNTDKYYNLIKSKHKIKCWNCVEVYERNQVQPYEMLLSNIDELILNKKKIWVWYCVKCGSIQPLEGSQTTTEVFKQPFYTGCIPEPPIRKGLHDRLGHVTKIREWFDIAFKEIEAQIGLYRTEYASQQSLVMETMPNE